jgi:lysophospholipase L1-like esterase
MRRITRWCLAALATLAATAPAAAQTAFPLRVEPGDRVVFIGNTFAERMSLFPHLEADLTALFPADTLSFRNLGWSGDEVALRPRPLNFGDLHTHLGEQRPDLIFAFFGMNESFAGAAGLPRFRADLRALLRELREHRYNGEAPPRVVLVSPIAHERVAHVPLDPAEHNRDLELYTAAMREEAEAAGVGFVDLFAPTRALVNDPALGDLTINGIHPDDAGYRLMSRLMLASLGLVDAAAATPATARCGTPVSDGRARLERAIREKNELFFYRWRPVNGEYVYGRRREPFGVVNFPPEMKRLEQMIREREREIWKLSRSGPRPGAECRPAQTR